MSTAKHTEAQPSPQEHPVEALWASARQSARRLGVTEAEMLVLLHSGKIPAARTPGPRGWWRVPVVELERYATEEAARQTAERRSEAS